MSDITNDRNYREEQALRDGDIIRCKDADYTIVGKPIGFGGSSILYGARRSGSEMLFAIKECFPAEGCCAFKRINGVIQPKDLDDGNAVAVLAHFRDSIENEKRIGQHIFNTTNRAVPTIDILEPISVTTEGKTYTQVSAGIFSVQPRFDLKARSLEDILNEINTNCSNEERRKTKGLPNIYFTACLLEEVLKALQQIHKARDPKNPKLQGWIFGDLSPKNIFFAETDIAQKHAGIAHFLDYGSSMELDEKGETKELAEKDIYSTDGYRPPEASVGAYFKLDQRADIYSAGCLLHRCVVSKAKFAIAAKKRSPVLGPAALDEIDGKYIGCTDRALKLLNDILDKATKEKSSERYPNVDDMLTAMLELKRAAEPVSYELPANLSSPDYFVPHSRDKELSALAKSVNQGETVFLHGVGGIGKTECAIQLAHLLNPPRGAYLVPFQNSMKETILKMKFSGYQFEARNNSLEAEAQEEAEYQERLKILQKHYRDTVLIIDNFDADNKALDELRREPAFVDFLGLDLKRIFTTRYPVGRKDWEIKELSDSALLKLMRHYCNDNNISDEQYLAILKEIQNHTLTATLIAKTLEESWGDITPEMILEALHGSRLSQEDYPEVVSDQNRSYQQRQIYEHLKALFSLSGMSEDDRVVLCCATLLHPQWGMQISIFKSCLKQGEQKSLRNLVKRGWLIRTKDNELVMHPIIREVCTEELKPDLKTCQSFLEGLWEKVETNKNDLCMWDVLDMFTMLPEPLLNFMTAERWEYYIDYIDNMLWNAYITENPSIKKIYFEVEEQASLPAWEKLNACSTRKQTVFQMISTWETLHYDEQWNMDMYISLAQYYSGGFVPNQVADRKMYREKALAYYKKAKELGAGNLDEKIESIEYELSEESEMALDEIVKIARDVLQTT